MTTLAAQYPAQSGMNTQSRSDESNKTYLLGFCTGSCQIARTAVASDWGAGAFGLIIFEPSSLNFSIEGCQAGGELAESTGTSLWPS